MDVINKIDINKELDKINQSFLRLMADILNLAQSSTTVVEHQFSTTYHKATVKVHSGHVSEVHIVRQ